MLTGSSITSGELIPKPYTFFLLYLMSLVVIWVTSKCLYYLVLQKYLFLQWICMRWNNLGLCFLQGIVSIFYSMFVDFVMDMKLGMCLLRYRKMDCNLIQKCCVCHTLNWLKINVNFACVCFFDQIWGFLNLWIWWWLEIKEKWVRWMRKSWLKPPRKVLRFWISISLTNIRQTTMYWSMEVKSMMQCWTKQNLSDDNNKFYVIQALESDGWRRPTGRWCSSCSSPCCWWGLDWYSCSCGRSGCIFGVSGGIIPPAASWEWGVH